MPQKILSKIHQKTENPAVNSSYPRTNRAQNNSRIPQKSFLDSTQGRFRGDTPKAFRDIQQILANRWRFTEQSWTNQRAIRFLS